MNAHSKSTPASPDSGDEEVLDGAKVVDLLAEGGLRSAVESWLGEGANETVTADQVADALGQETLANLAEPSDVSTDYVAHALAENLPNIVDASTRSGFVTPSLLTGPAATIGEGGGDVSGGVSGSLSVGAAFDGAFRRSYSRDWLDEQVESTKYKITVKPGDALRFGASSAMQRSLNPQEEQQG